MEELFPAVAMLLKTGVLTVSFFPLPDIFFAKSISLPDALAARITFSVIVKSSLKIKEAVLEVIVAVVSTWTVPL